MKKLLLRKVFIALVIIAVSGYFIDLQGQVQVNFLNETGARQSGISGGNDAALTLDFTIDAAGLIALDASTPEEGTDSGDSALVNSWDTTFAGSTDIPSLFDKSFSLQIKTNNKRLDNRNDYGGGFGIGGRNSGRIDDGGAEALYFILGGVVGVQIDSIKYNNTHSSAETHFLISDFDTDSVYYLKTNAGSDDTTQNLGDGVMSMRYAGDSLTITTDVAIGDGNQGGSLSGIYFSLVAPVPGVVETMPADADTLVATTSDYVIKFNTPMTAAATEAAVSFTPDVTSRVNTWNGEGDELTVSFDELPNYTQFEVVVAAAMESADGSNSDKDFAFTFQTLPDAPTILSTYPVNDAMEVPANTPMIIEFSRSMNRDSVQNSLSFDPELSDLTFSWNASSTKIVVSTAEMETFTDYTGTLSTNARDIYGVTIAEDLVFSFKTARGVAVENTKYQDVVLYPNPVSEVLYIKGMDVSAVNIHSITGQLMKSTYNSKEIDMSDIEPGSYVVTIADKSDISVRKMIVIQ